MNKEKIIMNTVIGIMSLILVYVMFIQFRIVNETDTGEIEFMRETELKETLANYKSKYSEVQEEMKEVQEKINEYKENEKSEEATIVLLEKEIKEANMKLGRTDVYGEGITIKMADTEEYTIMYTDLLELINELVYAGAEAISINDQRIISMSDLEDVGNFILINNERTTSPFTIKAIGDTTKLQSALNIKGGFVDKNDNIFSISIETGNINIKKYDGRITLNYAKS